MTILQLESAIVMDFGDNDLEMLDLVGFSYTMVKYLALGLKQGGGRSLRFIY